ncbi:MAG: hypothetical protein FWB99_10125 [Treponema sp.]|nr:hypothetical protein [Treponema sp.]
MFKCPLSVSKALPQEYRTVAEELFPSGGFPEGKGPSVQAAGAFADILGIGEDYRRLLSAHHSGQAVGDSLERFQNNLDLLIQKTWVEKSDETRKERLLDDVPPLIALIEGGDYSQALEEFGPLLEGLAYLFFGAQSQKDDFAEYALRIDPQMGLFWWYGGQINASRSTPWVKSAEPGVHQAMLFLGICYLTNF